MPSQGLAAGPVKVGVVGAGAFGRHHARHYVRNPAAALVAIADVDAVRAAAIAGEHGGRAYADYRAMIGAVDAVSIAVPASLHSEVAAAFIDAGVHVLVEKPLAASGGPARELLAKAVSKGVVLQVGHVERFSPAVEELARRVTNPRRIACVRRTPWTGRSADVDVVLDLMIHDIGHVLMLAGASPVSVSASGRIGRSEGIDEAEAWLTFPGGLVATLSASREADVAERTLVVTEPGKVFRADLAMPSLTVADRARRGSSEEPIDLSPRDNLAAEIDAFLTSVETGAPPLVGGREGLAALEVAAGIQAAIAEADGPVARSAP